MFSKVFRVTINYAGEFSYFITVFIWSFEKFGQKFNFHAFFLFLQNHTQSSFAAKLFYDAILTQCHIFEMLSFPRNEEIYWNTRKNWKTSWLVNIAKQSTFCFNFYVLYKLSTMRMKFQGHKDSQSEMTLPYPRIEFKIRK